MNIQYCDSDEDADEAEPEPILVQDPSVFDVIVYHHDVNLTLQKNEVNITEDSKWRKRAREQDKKMKIKVRIFPKRLESNRTRFTSEVKYSDDLNKYVGDFRKFPMSVYILYVILCQIEFYSGPS